MSAADHPGSLAVSFVTITRTTPSNFKFRTLTGIFAPTLLVTRSMSAFKFESHRTSKSNAKLSSPISYCFACSSCGAILPVLKLFSVNFFTFWRLFPSFLLFVASANAFFKFAIIGPVRVRGIILFRAYCTGINPATPTTESYKLASSFTAATPSAASCFTTSNFSNNSFHAALNRCFIPPRDSFPIKISKLALSASPVLFKTLFARVRIKVSKSLQFSNPKA
mmetsp:Transcript_13069/g.18011  ORF Transcript_13069/g.18011 Transcript_13069/m.18011 type:complete len:223 (-) Transcript_13069:436-1104(-)